MNVVQTLIVLHKTHPNGDTNAAFVTFFLGYDSAHVLGAAFIVSPPPFNLQKQTAVYFSVEDKVKILNCLFPQNDNSVAVTVIHQKRCSVGRVPTALSIFHQTFTVIKSQVEVHKSPSDQYYW